MTARHCQTCMCGPEAAAAFAGLVRKVELLEMPLATGALVVDEAAHAEADLAAAHRAHQTLAFPKPEPRKKVKGRKAYQHKKETKAIRAAVFARAKGHCEACVVGRPAVLDHWLGGSGRRRQQQSEETCWAICHACDLARTNNSPSAAEWNKVRESFCKAHGFSFTPHLEKGARA